MKITCYGEVMKQIILGIDPGYGRTGWAIISYSDNKPKLVAADLIETQKDSIFPQRINQIFDHISQLIDLYKPSCMAVESIFFQKNAKTAIDVSQARGVILLAGHRRDLPIYDYTPLQVKNALIGYGKGDKKQIIQILSFHLQQSKLPKQDDTCDAVAVALTHAYTNPRLKGLK